MIGVFVIPMLSDNFSYYVYTKGNLQQGFFVDVSEPEKLSAFTTALQITTVSHILTTHKHGDHSGGNQSLATQIGSTLKIVGGANDSIPACNHPVNDGDKLDDILPGVEITCLHTPCHTRGQIFYCLIAKRSQTVISPPPKFPIPDVMIRQQSTCICNNEIERL